MEVIQRLIIVLVICLLAKIEVKGQDEISVNFPSLDVQYDVIKNEGMIYGNETLTGLMGKSLRAFIAWSRQFTEKDYDVVMFSILPAYPTTQFKIPEELSEPVYDPEAELRAERIKNEINQYRFEVYPQYRDCDMHELLDGNKILVNVDPSLFDYPIRLNYKITAYIPFKKDDILPSKYANHQDDEKKYYKLVMMYDYRLMASLDKYEGTSDEKLYSFFEENIKKGYDSENGFLSFYISSSSSFKWNVKITFFWASLEIFDETNIPKGIVDLFPYKMFQ